MWRKFQKIGEDMALLSTNLFEMSQDFYREQKNCKAIVVANNSNNSDSAGTHQRLRLCKHCGAREDEDRRFLICGHSQCPYKYYHIRCLKSGQIASFQQQGNRCWYCPSCLCRACFLDRDDGSIVLCDGCDEAWHTYCMKPPRGAVPEGKWYCLGCNVVKEKEGMRKYERWILLRHGEKDVRGGDGEVGGRSMDALLSAVEKLSSEENLGAEK